MRLWKFRLYGQTKSQILFVMERTIHFARCSAWFWLSNASSVNPPFGHITTLLSIPNISHICTSLSLLHRIPNGVRISILSGKNENRSKSSCKSKSTIRRFFPRILDLRFPRRGVLFGDLSGVRCITSCFCYSIIIPVCLEILIQLMWLDCIRHAGTGSQHLQTPQSLTSDNLT
jgi:hypothetical protein